MTTAGGYCFAAFVFVTTFLPRDGNAMLARHMPSRSVRLCVCPSVYLSAMFVDSVETNEHIFNFFSCQNQ